MPESDLKTRLQANARRSEELEPLTVVLRPGQRVRVELAEKDSYFDIAFDEQSDGLITVYSSEPPPATFGVFARSVADEIPETIIYLEDFKGTQEGAQDSYDRLAEQTIEIFNGGRCVPAVTRSAFLNEQRQKFMESEIVDLPAPVRPKATICTCYGFPGDPRPLGDHPCNMHPRGRR